MLDNFPHIKSYWIMIRPRLAQVGLSFGADDIDGTVTEEKIAHDAGAQTPQVMTVHELVPPGPRGRAAAGRARHRLQRGQGMVSAAAPAERARDGAARAGTRVVRLGAVSYLNVGAARARTGPRLPASASSGRCPRGWRERLHAGEVDLGLIPSIEYAFGDYAIVPGVAIGSRGPVRSVCLFHHGPLDARAPRGPRHLEPHERRAREDPAAGAAGPRPAVRADGARPRATCWRSPTRRCSSATPRSTTRARSARLDLGEAWTRLTGLPFVFAFWAGRAGAVSAAGVRRLQAALAAGTPGAPRDRRAATRRATPRARAKYESYLRENIVYRLGEDEQAGLREFYRRAHALALIPAVPELRFHAEA